MDDERDLQDLRKDRVRVPHPALLAERVAVIGRDDDEALFVQAVRLQIVDELAEARIEPADA